MKTINFPEKKNQRRVRAYARLWNEWGLKDAPDGVRVELDTLYGRIKKSARSVMTKKFRGVRRQAARIAE